MKLSSSIAIIIWGVAATLAACGADKSAGQQDCSDLNMSQTLSEPCCPDYGVDACGASLFCAAFDGRTQSTCYADRSRLALTECNADTQCVSNSCHSTEGLCLSMGGETCTIAVGCADYQ